MKAVKTNERKYYKKATWEQPVLTSNTSSDKMTVSATNEGQGGAWKAFNNANSVWATSNGTTSGTIYVQLSEPIYLNSIVIQGYRNSYGYTKTVTIYSDTAKTNLIGTSKTFYTSTGAEGYTTNTWTFDEPIKVIQLTFDCVGGSNWVAVSEITIDAYTVESGTPSDYDFYKDVYVYKVVLENSAYKAVKF